MTTTSAGREADRLDRGPALRHVPAGGNARAMSSELARYLHSQLQARRKTLYFLAEFTGLDIRYLRRLASGEKLNPSTETLVKIAFALVASEEQFKQDPTLPMVLCELLLAGGYTAVGAARRL